MSLLILALVGCDHTGFGFRPDLTDAPSVSDLGEILPANIDDWVASGRDALAFPESVFYREIGADANAGKVTGATAHFTGTGGNLCLVLDPETVFWSRSMTSSGGGRYQYDDDYTDDGDLDMDAGLTAFYTGSPGVEMGDFEATYTDDAGADHSLEFNVCTQTGYGGAAGVHAGRATNESCVVNTDQAAGIEYTIALKTFSLPLNDSRLAYAVGVFDVGDRNCDEVFSTDDDPECLFPNEAGLGEATDRTDVEAAYCQGTAGLNTYCAAHLDDENPPCNESNSSYDPGVANTDTGE
ncbi:MAG: hypothetical protein EXR69_06415 [Myxococcales bacterium]|nr:hypothetical protein [Myxococcales bacterium]